MPRLGAEKCWYKITGPENSVFQEWIWDCSAEREREVFRCRQTHVISDVKENKQSTSFSGLYQGLNQSSPKS